jgi:predicted nucleic acid-binding protein
MPNRPLLLDACVAINLVAAGPIEQIALAVGRRFLITRQAAREVGHLRDTADGEVLVRPVDLSRHVQADAFEIIDMTADQIPLYVELAGLVDDGEASTIAVAIEDGLPLATDDRKARRVCAERGLPEPTRTVALIRQYCEAKALEQADVCRLIGRIRSRASFQPPRNDPDLKWWNDHEQGAFSPDSRQPTGQSLSASPQRRGKIASRDPSRERR